MPCSCDSLARCAKTAGCELAELAHRLDDVGRPDLALAVCREASRQAPHCGGVLFAMAFFMAKLDFPVEAIARVLQRAMEVAPNPILYRIEYALLLRRMGDHANAYRVLAETDASELAAVCSHSRLQDLIEMFRQAGDETRRGVCERELAGITRTSSEAIL